MTVSITVVTPGGLTAVAVWEDGELAGDEEIVETVASMERVGVEVRLTPVGPVVPVTKADVRSVIRGLEEYGTVKVAGTLPETDDEPLDVDF